MKIAVVGSGMSGLIAAYCLQKLRAQVHIYEKKNIGGLLQSELTPYGPVEYAATSFMTTPILRELAEVCGVRLVPAAPTARHRYLCAQKGKPSRWPLSVLETIRFGLGIARQFLSRLTGNAKSNQILFADYCEEKFGRGFAKKIALFVTQGIFAARADRLSAELVLQNFRNLRKLKKSEEFLCTPDCGFATWTKKISDYLQRKGAIFYSEQFQNSNFEKVVIATSLVQAQELAARIFPRTDALQSFCELQTVSLTSLTLFFKKLDRNYPGFGILFENENILGVVQNHQIFAERYNQYTESETWILRTPLHHDEILQFRAEKLGRTDQPVAAFPWNAGPAKLPLYDLKLEMFLTRGWDTGSVQFVGNYLGQIGLSGLSTLIEKQVETFLQTGSGCIP